MTTLTEKERTLLEDEKKHEELCIEKYNKYASQATCPELKTLFKDLGSKEQQHLDTINQILSGSMPNVNASQSNQQMQQAQQQMQQSQQQMQQQSQMQMSSSTATDKKSDSYLCEDALSTEKFVSSSYNTAIFEFKDPTLRQTLNHIQKEEQEHGEKIYNYMAQNGMYN